jgi:DNA-binding response OmpR family regulator
VRNPLHVLIVNPDADLAGRLAGLLQAAGYRVTALTGFHEASARLKSEPFDAVVAAERLGTHNGLHLLIRARAERRVVAVVTCAEPDPVLENDARELGATCLVAPWHAPAGLLAVIAGHTGAASL